ncbi:heme ABC transporter ATP-binding protein [Micrococcoides hystricis]|uniref:Heme ABC transporter ATP-binding protein n=1 Tax=Micrococcoides hystricis TaxID=1572761 RepID=A0ABV6PAM0_9MICC
MEKLALQSWDISATRGGRNILSGVDMQLKKGTLNVIIGPNGAGKSTLIDVLSGEDQPRSGKVEIFGRDLRSMTVLEQAQQRAVMAQETAVSFAFTVEEIVEMGRQCWAKTPCRELDQQNVTQAIQLAQLDHLAEARITEVSGGERQRAAFARVLAQDTPLIILDEPVAAMDIKHQEQTLQTIRRLCTEGRTALVVLHDLSFAAHYADQLILLAQGQVVSAGKPQVVCDPEILSAVYETRLHVHTDMAGKVISIVPERSSFLSFAS